MAVAAKTSRYVELDNKGYEIGAIEFGEIRLEGTDIPDELAEEGDVEKISQYLIGLGYPQDVAHRDATKAKEFYSLGADCLWITFANGHLCWTFAHPQVTWVSNDEKLIGRIRSSIGGWRNCDIYGNPLLIDGLSGRMLQLDKQRQDPDEEALRDLLALINGASNPSRQPGQQPIAITLESINQRPTEFPHQIPWRLHTVAGVAGKPSAAPDEAGLYAWWFDELPNVPLTGAPEQNGFRLAYVGIASSRPGSRRTLRQRLRNHFAGSIATSTLRRSLAAILLNELDLHPRRMPGQKTRLDEGEERRLSDWLAAHGRVAWIADEAPWLLEAELLQNGPALALNIRGNTHPFVRELLTLRQQLSDMPVNPV